MCEKIFMWRIFSLWTVWRNTEEFSHAVWLGVGELYWKRVSTSRYFGRKSNEFSIETTILLHFKATFSCRRRPLKFQALFNATNPLPDLKIPKKRFKSLRITKNSTKVSNSIIYPHSKPNNLKIRYRNLNLKFNKTIATS